MESLPDLAKKTSINSLLNPEASSDGFVPNLSATLGHGDVYGGSFGTGPSFNLRAASWGGHDDRRKTDNGRHYQTGPQQQHEGIDMYSASRVGRERDDAGYGLDPRLWVNGTSQEYSVGAPTIAPMYSDERTALSGDYTHTANYTPAYSDADSQWQLTERASARLVARGYNNNYYQPYPQFPDSQPQTLSPSQPLPFQPRVVQPPKRRTPDEESEPPPKKRTKPTPAAKPPSTSKRGYPAKKRSEAAQIAAQNAKMPQLSYTTKGKEKANNGGGNYTMQIVPTGPNDQGQVLHAEPQSTRCMSTKYKHDPFPRCVACTRRWAGDTCRFQGIRFFLRDTEMKIVGVTFSETQKADLPSMKFPTEWNEPLTAEHIFRTKTTIAKALLPTLRQELTHLRLPTIVHRPREREVRATCDTCMTSIFSTSWICRLCGREACADCYATVVDLTAERPGMDARELQALQARREKHQYANPFFLQCTKRVEHKKHDFSPMSRFCEKELDTAIKEMEGLMEGLQMSPPPPQQTQNPVQHPYAWQQQQQQQNGVLPGPGPSSRHTNPYAPDYPLMHPHPQSNFPPSITSASFLPTNLSQITLATPSRIIRRFTPSSLTPSSFPSLWALGEPLVVVGLLPFFRIQWTPEYFIEKYGSQSCLVIECQTEVNKRLTVGEFFSQFGKYAERAGAGGAGAGAGKGDVWKLKDWPPSMDFRKAFPELYEDFGGAVPVPSYVRRDGVMNLASHFPEDTVSPDIGPKMYNAMATTQEAGSKGSTRLHMDMADAINIMTYSAPAPDGSQGCAAWDLFRAEDSDKLRAFLAEHARSLKEDADGKKTGGGGGGKDQGKSTASGAGAGAGAGPLDWVANDPIHGQQFYLDEEMRRRLYEQTGVQSYRFYQRPGDAVFIPAGCAHQVANLADCIKVAVDFVSPQNVERCEKLTKEFREQNQRKMWKEDVLQLRTMMWFAWLSCRQQETREDSEEED